MVNPKLENVVKTKPTKEEKLAIKAEKKRLKLLEMEETKKNNIRDHLKREMKYTDLTYRKASDDWEKLCSDIKVSEFRIDMQRAWQSVNRSLDIKAHLIERILQECEEADDQYRRNIDKHTNIIEYLLKFYSLFLDAMKNMYDSECDKLITDFHCEIRNKNRICERRNNYYENILLSTNFITSKKLENKHREFICNKDELINKNAEHRYIISEHIKNNMENIYKIMHEVIQSMMDNSASPARQKLYTRLVNKESAAHSELKIMYKKATTCEKTIFMLQKKLTDIELKSANDISDLKYERKFFAESFSILKMKYDNDLIRDESQMKHLAGQTYLTINNLKKVKRYGELILALSSVCRKHQTEKEKVLPWPDNSEELIKNSVRYEDTLKSLDHISQMELFWYKVSLAEKQNISLREEKKSLEEENELLKDRLRKFCHQQTYNSVISSLKLNPFPTCAIPVQEASHMIQLRKPSDK